LPIKKGPITVYTNIPVRRKKKPNLFLTLLIILLILAIGYFIYAYLYQKQFLSLTANLFMTESPLRIQGTGESLENEGSVNEGQTVVVSIDNDKVIFLIGIDITTRMMSLSRIRFNSMKRDKRKESNLVDISLLKGHIWVTKESPRDTVIINHPLAKVELDEKSQVELRTTVADSLEILCWKGKVSVTLPTQQDEPINLRQLRRTTLKKSGAMASPFDIIPEDMIVWEAWNLETDVGHIVTGTVPTFNEAFLAQRKKWKIKGGFSGRVSLTAATIISGQNQVAGWQEGGISSDSQVVISYREDKISRNRQGDLRLEISLRNDGKIKASGISVVAEALSRNGRVLGRQKKKIPKMEPFGQQQMKFEIIGAPNAVNYRLRFLFPD